MGSGDDEYLAREARARKEIDRQLGAAGWVVQSAKYVDGLPGWMKPPVTPLPFRYESTGAETRFTNGQDPQPRSRRVFTFHRPETLAAWIRQAEDNPDAPTFRARRRTGRGR
jgi:type I site-specific restriction endonuclease